MVMTLHPWIEVTVVEHRVLGITRDEQNFEIRAGDTGSIRELTTAHSADPHPGNWRQRR